MHCRKWKSRTVVERVPERPQCPLCGARLIAALKPWDEELIPAVTKKKKSEEERAIEVRFLRNANIVLSSGKKAVTALAAKVSARRRRRGSWQPSLRGIAFTVRS